MTAAVAVVALALSAAASCARAPWRRNRLSVLGSSAPVWRPDQRPGALRIKLPKLLAPMPGERAAQASP